MNKKQAREAAKAAKAEKATKKAPAASVIPDAPKPAKAAKVAKEVKEGALPALPKLPSASRARKPKPMQPCTCGCKTPTRSMWAPGHDARARGWAIRIERGVLESIKDVPANERNGAEYMLKLRKEMGTTGKMKLVNKGPVAVEKPEPDVEAEGEEIAESDAVNE